MICSKRKGLLQVYPCYLKGCINLAIAVRHTFKNIGSEEEMEHLVRMALRKNDMDAKHAEFCGNGKSARRLHRLEAVHG